MEPESNRYCIMHRLPVIILFTFVAQAHGKELTVNHPACAKKLTANHTHDIHVSLMRIAVHKLVGKLVNKLVDRAVGNLVNKLAGTVLKSSPVHHLPRRALHAHRSPFTAPHSSFPAPRPKFTLSPASFRSRRSLPVSKSFFNNDNEDDKVKKAMRTIKDPQDSQRERETRQNFRSKTLRSEQGLRAIEDAGKGIPENMLVTPLELENSWRGTLETWSKLDWDSEEGWDQSKKAAILYFGTIAFVSLILPLEWGFQCWFFGEDFFEGADYLGEVDGLDR